MKHFAKIAAFGLVAVALLAITACTEAQKDDTFAIICGSVPVADALFQNYAGTGKVSAKVMSAEKVAVDGAQGVCDGPRPADTRTAIAAVQRALTAIANATSAARAQAGA